MIKKLLSNRRFRYGGLATIITVIFIAAVVLVNIIAGLLVTKYPTLKFDLTAKSVFEVTQPTIDYLKKLEKPITITVLSDEDTFKAQSAYGEYGTQTKEVLKKYAQYSDKITIKYVNMTKNPEIASKYSKYSVSEGDVVVESGELVRVLTDSDLYDIKTDESTYSRYIAASAAEQALTSAVMYVTDANPMTATIVSGYGETQLAAFQKLLEKNGYEVKSINLLTEEIDPNTALVVIAAPTIDYSETQIKKLDTYLDNSGKLGKNLLYCASYNQPSTPNLDAFLADWGVSVGTGIVYETDNSNYYQYPIWAVQQYASDKFKDKLANSTAPVIVPNCRPVKTLFTTSDARSTEALIKSYSSTVLAPVDANQDWTADKATEKGEFNGVVLAQKKQYEGTTAQISSVAVFGSTDMLSDNWLQLSEANNGDYTISMINGLTGKEAGITIVPKSIGGASLNMTAGQAQLLTYVFLLILPLAVIILGIIVWVRRRHL